ncbi:hypothetical protein T11_14486, partial [Trichinella zimbabwensis]
LPYSHAVLDCASLKAEVWICPEMSGLVDQSGSSVWNRGTIAAVDQLPVRSASFPCNLIWLIVHDINVSAECKFFLFCRILQMEENVHQRLFKRIVTCFQLKVESALPLEEICKELTRYDEYVNLRVAAVLNCLRENPYHFSIRENEKNTNSLIIFWSGLNAEENGECERAYAAFKAKSLAEHKATGDLASENFELPFEAIIIFIFRERDGHFTMQEFEKYSTILNNILQIDKIPISLQEIYSVKNLLKRSHILFERDGIFYQQEDYLTRLLVLFNNLIWSGVYHCMQFKKFYDAACNASFITEEAKRKLHMESESSMMKFLCTHSWLFQVMYNKADGSDYIFCFRKLPPVDEILLQAARMKAITIRELTKLKDQEATNAKVLAVQKYGETSAESLKE